MDLEIQRSGESEFLMIYSLPKCTYLSYGDEKLVANGDDDDVQNVKSENFDFAEAESLVINSIGQDNKAQLVAQARRFAEASSKPVERSTVSKLLHLCCNFDSPECASALLSGELGPTPLVNELNESGRSALHTAALAHAAKCVEVLLKKHARTGLRTRDGHAQLALDLALCSTRMDVIWTPDDYSVEDLIVVLGEKDLTTVKLLSEKTKEIGEVAYASAVEGSIVTLAALLIVAAETVNESLLEWRDNDSGSKEKLTLYECVIREALSLGHPTTPSTAAKRASMATESYNSEKRRLLLMEIELLQLFGAVAQSGCTDKKVTSPLIRATQVGDEAIIQLLLKTNLDVNDADAEGSSALHWTLKLPKSSCLQQIKILWLLIKHGARVSQRNKLGLTAFHIAAGNGNSEALQILLLEDPDGIQYKTEIKETPLFFAVRNESMKCTELLLSWGANSEILNLRQRPIDLTSSQDVRFMLLNPPSVRPSNIILPSQHNMACSQGDEEFSGNRDLLTMIDEGTMPDRKIQSSCKLEICKYFDSPRGCARGAKCFYSHGKEEHQTVKLQGAVHKHSLDDTKAHKRIFVGGLPPSVNSGSLGKFFEAQFGPVDDSVVILAQIENKIQSRGFGFVTFKEEKSVSEAVEAHFINMLGKPVEIKSIVPRMATEGEKLSPQQQEQEKNFQFQLPAQISPREMIVETNNKPEQGPWVCKLLHGQPKTSPGKPQAHMTKSSDNSLPIWLKTFKKWFPGFLYDLSKHPRNGGYALSSLKADFKAKFGLELDHASLGIPKLSEFIKHFSKICAIKVVTSGPQGNANHTVLVPQFRPHHQLSHAVRAPCSDNHLGISKCLQDITIDDHGDSECVKDISVNDNGGDSECVKDILIDNCGDSKRVQDISIDSGSDSQCLQALPISSGGGNSGLKNPPGYRKEKPSYVHPEVNSNSAKDTSFPDVQVQPRFLQFLQPDPVFHGRNNVHDKNGSANDSNQHLVLEAVSRKRNKSSSFFLRDFNFYKDYKECIMAGKCFGCNKNQIVWANFPCQHLVWCSACKAQAILAAGDSAHKCVVCDAQVPKMILVLKPHDEFPPIDPSYLQISSPSMKKTSPLSGY